MPASANPRNIDTSAEIAVTIDDKNYRDWLAYFLEVWKVLQDIFLERGDDKKLRARYKNESIEEQTVLLAIPYLEALNYVGIPLIDKLLQLFPTLEESLHAKGTSNFVPFPFLLTEMI